MRTLFQAAAILTVLAAFASTAHAAGWAITIDVPATYNWDAKGINDPIPPNNGQAVFSDGLSTNLSGYAVMFIAPFHLGLGYEDYTVGQKTDIPVCSCGQQGDVTLAVRMVDVMIDVPTRYLNIGLGYGTGSADASISLPAATGVTVPKTSNVSAEQYFIVLGLPLGMSRDIHVGYHVVSIAKPTITDSAGNMSKLTASGAMTSLGLRQNF